MLKEIAEQPQAVADTLLGRLTDDGRLMLDEMRLSDEDLREVDKIIVVACGTAFHAGLVAKYAIEHWTRIPCEVELAREFRYRDPVLTRSTLVVAISQSGETMDTLMALRHAREQGARVLAICNTNGSTIPRESDAVLYTHAGPEVAVASTKAFLTQLVACYLVGLLPGAGARHQVRRRDRRGRRRAAGDARTRSTGAGRPWSRCASWPASSPTAPSVLFLGRHVGYPVALEGALKLKELAYMHAEGFAAGELKHGPIALIEEGVPVIVVVPSPRGRQRAARQDRVQHPGGPGARRADHRHRGGGRRGGRALRRPPDPHPRAPTLLQPLLSTVPLQVFACEMATARGHDVDQPRNLAKSVTVE